ncbi:hypothetical protein PAXINDRAFT_5887 [Paxillus involutus ATCC 200175]|nr:hypothetical protein PAXINDRAFT_5887 [Paxillus involutus ATCC 200175]
MISRKVLNELLQKPLGPYHDHHVLDGEECQTKLVLYSFMLEHNGQVIGLDESERPLEGPGPDDRRFRFRGVLKIADPDWLSDFGLKTVEAELNLRADERALREGERRGLQLTLNGLFKSKLLKRSNSAWNDESEEEETKLTILIQGEKSLPAVFMQSSSVPDGLLWNSKDHLRKYQIATMDVDTYSRSENYFWRWRLVTLMEKIAKKYSYIPVGRQTPDWFVTKYLTDFACPQEDVHRRLIFDEDDSDVDEEGNTKTPRQLLKPHRSEVLGLFAAHAEWFVTNGEVRRKKLFNFKSWDQFRKQARKERREAARQGVAWGWPVGRTPEDLSSSEEDEEVADQDDQLDQLVKRNPVIGKTNKAVARKIELARKKKAHPKRIIESSSSGSENEEADPTTARVYASDFSEPSEEASSDSDDVNEEALLDIPWELQVPPRVPDADGRWWCPLPGCEYLIDLRSLTEENGRDIPGDLILRVVRKQWRNAAQDRDVLEGFSRMVINHYSNHFEERGVRWVKRNGGDRVAWINAKPQGGGREGRIRGPMPPLGSLGGELRVIPTLHIPRVAD